MALAEATEEQHTMHKQMKSVTEFLMPFFPTGIGMQLKSDVFRDSSAVVLTILITLVAVATKLFGGGAGTISLGLRCAGQVGIGMVPRGEVAVGFAQTGIGAARDQLDLIIRREHGLIAALFDVGDVDSGCDLTELRISCAFQRSRGSQPQFL